MGTHIAGVCAQGATSPFDGVTVILGIVQMGCGDITGLLSRWSVGMGLAKGNRGLFDPLEHPFVLG